MSMMNAARPLDPWRWLATPALLCVLATMLFAVPIRAFGLQLPEPVFPIICAFAWPLLRPSVLAPFILVILGLFLDLYWGGPIGLWGLAFLAVYATLLAARSIMTGQSRGARQVWFAMMTALAMGVGFAVSVINSHNVPNLLAVFWQFLGTIVLYPFAHRLIERFEDADVRFR
jgi:rod shape-determining protein MreD